MIPLSEELDLVRSYIRLEQSRFGERVRLNETIQPDLLEAQVPVFTLQPIIENAIKHGLASRQSGGTLQLRIHALERELQIEVADDGVGISAERLQEVSRFDGCLSRGTSGTGIGLHNVHRRIQATFGANYGLQLSSQLGQGTVVRIRMPLVHRSEGDAI